MFTQPSLLPVDVALPCGLVEDGHGSDLKRPRGAVELLSDLVNKNPSFATLDANARVKFTVTHQVGSIIDAIIDGDEFGFSDL
jgi:hypothetical protein